MSRPRFLADHDLNNHIIRGLHRVEPTIEFVRAREVSMHDRPDPEVLAFAAHEGFIVVTHDARTMIGHAWARVRDGLPMPGLLIARQELGIGPMIDDLLLIALTSEAEQWRQRVEYLSAG